MKRIAAPKQDFNTYIARPDTEFIVREQEPLQELYAIGYLPHSATKNLCNVFYSARSARVLLPKFELTSENRRIARKFDGRFSKQRIRNFTPDEFFYTFCAAYFAAKHGPDAMPRDRLEHLMGCGLISNTTVYCAAGVIVAYVLEVEYGTMSHYWFSFYDPVYAKQSLGLWLMLDHIRDAKERGLQEYYLGTVYGDKALYKTNFEPLGWWDGHIWNSDITLLKILSRND
jgi:arginine-tRNA-protein transferase